MTVSNGAAICVRGVSKRYLLYDRPQDRLKHAFLWRIGKGCAREFWALRDISFEVNRGETIGVIGRNGSGKSTLLQIIAGILKPTCGEVTVHGRVSALLELGSGFDPEYTGRENVYMNGAILGLSPAEVDERFDAIAAFADIGQFIDQPVKLYSSGMFVRLAFAVATSFDPDILVVDEALAVGDIRFQHKCMARIKQMVDRGVSVLLVSHAPDTVKRFCQRALWLEQGENRYMGEAGAAVDNYLAFLRMLEADAQGEPERQIVVTPSADGADRAIDSANADLPPADELPLVTSLDMLQPDCYMLGSWQATRVHDYGAPAQVTEDDGALAAFRFEGSELDLRFLHHPWSGSVRIVIDGQSHLVPLHRPAGLHVGAIRFTLCAGQHSVYLLKGPNAGPAARQVWWLGGRLAHGHSQPKLKRDPKLGLLDSEVQRHGTGRGRLTAVELLDYETEEAVVHAKFGQWLRLRLHAECLTEGIPRVEFAWSVRERNRIDLFGTSTYAEHVRLEPGRTHYIAEFAFQVRLGPGSYSVRASLYEAPENLEHLTLMDQVDTACIFTVLLDPDRFVEHLFYEPVEVTAWAW